MLRHLKNASGTVPHENALTDIKYFTEGQLKEYFK